MSTYEYKVAVNVLTEVEKNRFLACYLNSTDTNAVDWQRAADDFGSASVGSFKKMIQTAFKKVKDAQENGGGTAPAAPSSAKAKGGKKRKTADDAGDDAEEKPKAKKGKKGKKASPEADGSDAVDGQAEVKAEGEDDA